MIFITRLFHLYFRFLSIFSNKISNSKLTFSLVECVWSIIFFWSLRKGLFLSESGFKWQRHIMTLVAL
ncbi:hypothetical protein Lalb_Chr01g0015691 [Lupinus albus]|uniref:Uncharacterized protein n=1 Tax=Lupinus albus TaxID=3870 RepID=A0A6A4R768_LUPAL|nr:hypothetical protein Lalb_Chr01g0015691 [Lupinus albus]